MKKLIALLLAFIMVAVMFVSCNNGQTPSGDGKESSSSTQAGAQQPGSSKEEDKESETPAETENEYAAAGLPEDLKFGGSEVTIVHWDEHEPEFFVDVEDLNGDPINDAIYKRNLYTEQLLEVKLNFVHNEWTGNSANAMTNWCNKVKNMMDDPATPVDIMACYSRNLSTATVRGLNQDVTVYSNLDLEKEWWPKNILEELSLDNKLFVITGEISTNVLHNMYTVFFNKDMVEKFGAGDLVQMVRDREWTIDKMIEITKNVYQDLDETEGKSDGDQFAMSICWWCADALIQGAGIKILETDNENDVYLKISDDFMSEKLDSLVSKLGEWSATDEVFNESDYDYDTVVAFAEGRSMLLLDAVSKGFDLQDSDVNYGILPAPMLDPEAQENYVTTLESYYSNYSMSRNCVDGEKAAAVLQTMGYYGHKLTTPAIFEVTFKGKFSKDDDMLDMFDLVRECIGFDPALLYMREISSINDLPTKAILNNKKWLGVTMSSLQMTSLNRGMSNLNKNLSDAVNS